MAEEQIARYIKIAQDICGRILVGEYQEGMMLKGRSVLASFYNVSPETIRKAVNLLAKEKIVEIKRGVGIFVDSALHAQVRGLPVLGEKRQAGHALLSARRTL